MYKKKITTILMIALLTVSLSACGIKDIIGGGDTTEYKESKDIYLSMSSVKTLNPVISKDKDTYFISKIIYNGLFEMDKNMTPQPKLVSSYKFDESNSHLKLRLKSGVIWHDGKSFTADDVKYSIEAYKKVGTAGVYGTYVDNISSVTADNSNTVSIYYDDAENVSVADLTFPILPQQQYGDIYALTSAEGDFKPVGTGLYKYKKYDKTDSLKLSANKNYFEDTAQNNITFTILPKDSYKYNLIEAGSLTAVFSERQDRYALVSDSQLKRVDFPSSEAEYIGFNVKKTVLSEKDFRKAISYAIDSKGILEGAYYNSGIRTDSIYYPNYLGTESKKDAYPLSESKASKYLKELGYKDNDGNGILEDKDGNELKLEVLVNSDDKSRVMASKIIKESLDNLQINAYITECGKDEYKSKLTSGSYDIFIGGYKFDETFDAEPLLDSGSGNYTGFTDDKLTELLKKMKSGITNEEAVSTYKEIKKILTDEVPYYCMFYRSYGAIQSTQLREKTIPQFDNYYKGCESWICKFEVTDDTSTDTNATDSTNTTNNN